VTEEYKPHRPTAKRLFQQVGSRYALSNPVLLLFLIPAFGVGIIFDQTRSDATFEYRLISAIIGYIATIVPLLIARIFLPNKPRPSRPALLMVVFALAGLIRGLTLLEFSILSGQFQEGEILYRLVGGPLFTLISLILNAIVVSNYARHKEALSMLAAERLRLQVRSAGVLARVQQQQEELSAKVESLIRPAIRKIQETLASASSAAVIGSLRDAADEVIRPLSREVAEGQDDLNFENEPAAVRVKSALPKRVILGEFLIPFWAATMSIGLLVSSTVLLEEPAMTLIVLTLIFALVFGFGRIVQALTYKLEIPTLAAWVLVPLVYTFPLSAFFVLKPILNMQSTDAQLFTMLFFEWNLGLLLFFAQLVQLQRRETTERLKDVNRQLEVISSRLSQELWLNRKRMAALLHGPIQAALYASAMGMAQTNNPTPDYLTKVQKDIETALEQLNNPNRLESETLLSVLNQIKELWSGSVEVEIEIPTELELAITNEPLTCEATIELARELVTNSIKHGQASKVKVTINQIDPTRFSVEVTDNGKAPLEGATPGYGTKVLNELSLNWERTRLGDTTRSYAEMVLAQDSV
jgi:signal transduction histidine kinase